MADTLRPAPRTFISYSWSSPTHESWVLALAGRLRQDGVDAILDKWDLKPGDDAYKFMEQMVTDETVTKVVMVCDQVYCEKANKREGGVGAECQIISPELYGKATQGKFAAIITELNEDGTAKIPVFYKGRIYFDFSADEAYEAQYEELLRWIYERPARVKPALGAPPAHIVSDVGPVIATESHFRRAVDAIRSSSSAALGYVREYSDALIEDFEKLRFSYDGSVELDELVVSSIASAKPYVDQVISLTSAIAKFSRDSEVFSCVLRLFEGLAPYMERPEHLHSWNEVQFDNYRYLCHEIFVATLAILIREERFDLAVMQLGHAYLSNYAAGNRATRSYDLFSVNLKSLEIRNARLQLQRSSVHADMLSTAYKGRSPNFIDIMQADFVLYIRDAIPALLQRRYFDWDPITLIYASDRGRPFEIFGRSESKAYFSRIVSLFGDYSVESFKRFATSLQGSREHVPQYRWRRLPILQLANIANLGALP